MGVSRWSHSVSKSRFVDDLFCIGLAIGDWNLTCVNRSVQSPNIHWSAIDITLAQTCLNLVTFQYVLKCTILIYLLCFPAVQCSARALTLAFISICQVSCIFQGSFRRPALCSKPGPSLQIAL